MLSDAESPTVSLERRDTRSTNEVEAIHTMAEIPAGRDQGPVGIGRAHPSIYAIILSKNVDTIRTVTFQAVEATTAHLVDTTMVPASDLNTPLKVRDGCQTIKLDPTPLNPVTSTPVLTALRESRWTTTATGSKQLEAMGLDRGAKRRRSRKGSPIRAMSREGRLRANEGYKCCLVQESRTVELVY